MTARAKVFLSDIIPYAQYIHDFTYKLCKQHAGGYAFLSH